MKTIEEINLAITQTKKMVALLEELKISLEAEQRRYVIKFEYLQGNTPIFSLYDNDTQSLMIMDKAERLMAYLNLKKATTSDMYFHPNAEPTFKNLYQL